MKRFLVLCLSAALTVGLLAGCGGNTNKDPGTSGSSAGSSAGSTSGGSSSVSSEPVEVPTSGQNVVQTAVTLIAGEKLGIWEKLGLDVTRTHYVSGPPQLEANPVGDWDIGWIGATAAINGILNYDMKVIGLSGYDYSNMAFARSDDSIVLAGDKGVPGTLGSADEWRGKDIICGVGTVNYCDVMLTLNALGLTDEDVNIINMDISTGLQAFLAGEGDVYFPSSTYTTACLNAEGVECVHTMEGMDAGMAGNLIANAQYLADNEETTVKYLAGALEVLMWLHDEANNEQAAEWFSECMKDEFGVETTVEEALDNIKLVGFRDLSFYESLCEKDADGLTGMQKEFQKFFEYHVTMGSYEESQMDQILAAVDTSYLEKAIQLYKTNNNIA